jgi:urease accessory protein UreE
MPGNLIQHVIQKRQARVEAALARAIQIQADLNLSLSSIATDLGNSHNRSFVAMIHFRA